MTTKVESTVPFTMHVDKDICEEFAALCATMNISMSAGISSLMQHAVTNREFGFDVLDENGFTPDEAAELLRRVKDVEAGRLEFHELMTDNSSSICPDLE